MFLWLSSIQAGDGQVSIGGATSRRRLNSATPNPDPLGAARPFLREKLRAGNGTTVASTATAAPQRALLQTVCTIEAAQSVPGDIDFDCIFDLAGDVLAMDQVGRGSAPLRHCGSLIMPSHVRTNCFSFLWYMVFFD
jgi:hypothetical protein